ncbi:MAG: phenylalanine--tRNA ligase subunit beta [Alphaproteobacteria bacterium]|nr:MAG: phenylalanine--tRNA ligase subunit beta [Alphaproteobacteria bacterium]
MKFTLDWLKDHIDIKISPEEIERDLVNAGLEVESCVNEAAKYEGFVLGQIEEIEKHPDADKLNLCLVNIGAEKMKVVCGAPNVKIGLKVVFAKVGAVIPSTGDVLKPGKIRGIESRGMLCSATELGLGEGHDGIMELETNLPLGSAIAEVLELNNVTFDLSITPNRSDCFSVRGIARELAASQEVELTPLSPKLAGYKEQDIIHPDCEQFYIAHITGVKNKQSPEFIEKRLKAAGMTPKNFLVDITNYLALDLGQPLHIHDASVGVEFSARHARDGEKMTTLKGQDLTLTKDDVVITAQDRPVALAGIMGGIESSVTDSTVDIIVESALFDPIKIALSGRRYNILSESRTRFERGVDPEMVSYAFYKTIEMVLANCGGTVKFIQKKHKKVEEKIVEFHMKTFEKRCGFSLSADRAAEHLMRLGFGVVIRHHEVSEVRRGDPIEVVTTSSRPRHDGVLMITVPSFRHDVEIEEDIVEELLRLEGLEALESQALPLWPVVLEQDENVKQKLINRGLYEVYTWSMLSEKEYALFSKDSPRAIDNPITQNLAVMRPSILPGLLNVAVHNQYKRQNVVGLFEEAKVYSEKSGEQRMIAGLRAGQFNDRTWHEKQRKVDIFDIKADCMSVLPEVKMQLTREAPAYYHPLRSGALKQGKNVLGYFGELHPKIVKEFDIKGPAVGFEVFLDNLPRKNSKVKLPELSSYPSVPRDLCFIMKQNVMAVDVVSEVEKIDRALIHDVSVFDVYELPDGQKSVAFDFYYQSMEKTLSEEEITALTDKIIKMMKDKFDAELRG